MTNAHSRNIIYHFTLSINAYKLDAVGDRKPLRRQLIAYRKHLTIGPVTQW